MVKSPRIEEFLVSFLVDARGGQVQSKRFPLLNIFVPPNATVTPTRMVCHFLNPRQVTGTPKLNDCDEFASRILQMHSSCARFNKPIIIEVPHIASLRNGEREIVVMRKNLDGGPWKEHSHAKDPENLREIFGELFDSLVPVDDLASRRMVRIVTDDIPQYFALISRFHRDSSIIGPDGGSIHSRIDDRIKVIFPQNVLLKKMQISLEVQTVDPAIIYQVLDEDQRVYLSPIVTVEPKRRKFRDLIKIQIPLPKGVDSRDLSNVRILFSIEEFDTRWEDVSGTLDAMVHDNCISLPTKISARVWLIEAAGIEDVASLSNTLYALHCRVPYISRFVAYARRLDQEQCKLRLILHSDDSSKKTLETQEHFQVVATGPEVEISNKMEYQIETVGNLIAVGNRDEGIGIYSEAFVDSRVTLPLIMRNDGEEFSGKVALIPRRRGTMKQSQAKPITSLDIDISGVTIEQSCLMMEPVRKNEIQDTAVAKESNPLFDITINVERIADKINSDWMDLAKELNLDISEIINTTCECCTDYDKALIVCTQWYNKGCSLVSLDQLKKALNAIDRNDVVESCLEDHGDINDNYISNSMNGDGNNATNIDYGYSWDTVLKPIKNLIKHSDSVNDSMVAETGDDWSERNRDEGKSMSESSEEKSIVRRDSSSKSVANEPPESFRHMADCIVQSDKRTDDIMSFLAALSDSTPEPTLYNIDPSQDEAPQTFVSEKLSMSAVPSYFGNGVDEEYIVPVHVSLNLGDGSLGKIIDGTKDISLHTEKENHVPNRIKDANNGPQDSDSLHIKPESILEFLSQLDKVIPEPKLYSNEEIGDDGMEYPRHEKVSMSCPPSYFNVDFQEELIIPAVATKTFGNFPIETLVEMRGNTTAEGNDSMKISEDPHELLETHMQGCEVIKEEPEIYTGVEESFETMADGSTVRSTRIKTPRSMTETSKVTREITEREAEEMRRVEYEEPIQTVITRQTSDDCGRSLTSTFETTLSSIGNVVVPLPVNENRLCTDLDQLDDEIEASEGYGDVEVLEIPRETQVNEFLKGEPEIKAEVEGSVGTLVDGSPVTRTKVRTLTSMTETQKTTLEVTGEEAGKMRRVENDESTNNFETRQTSDDCGGSVTTTFVTTSSSIGNVEAPLPVDEDLLCTDLDQLYDDVDGKSDEM